MKKLLIAAVVLGAAGTVGHMHASMQSYYPVIKVASPDDISYTVVLEAVNDRPACGTAGKNFIAPVRERCPECEVVWARCERELSDLELALNDDRPVPMYVVSMAGVRVAIAAEPARASVACNLIATDAVRNGAPHAVCVFPAGD